MSSTGGGAASCSSSVLLARMRRELEVLRKDPPHGVAAWPGGASGDSLVEICAEIEGPQESPYAVGMFRLSVRIPPRYPFEPPSVMFLTRVYHPNVDNRGRISLDSLKMPPAGQWQPSLNVGQVLAQIRLLLAEPNPDDPLMADIAELYRHNKKRFNRLAKAFTDEHASASAAENENENARSTADAPLSRNKLPSSLELKPKPRVVDAAPKSSTKFNDDNGEDDDYADDFSSSSEEEDGYASKRQRLS